MKKVAVFSQQILRPPLKRFVYIFSQETSIMEETIQKAIKVSKTMFLHCVYDNILTLPIPSAPCLAIDVRVAHMSDLGKSNKMEVFLANNELWRLSGMLAPALIEPISSCQFEVKFYPVPLHFILGQLFKYTYIFKKIH